MAAIGQSAPAEAGKGAPPPKSHSWKHLAAAVPHPRRLRGCSQGLCWTEYVSLFLGQPSCRCCPHTPFLTLSDEANVRLVASPYKVHGAPPNRHRPDSHLLIAEIPDALHCCLGRLRQVSRVPQSNERRFESSYSANESAQRQGTTALSLESGVWSLSK
ncbi:hypothetical protein IQ07DRAFT_253288 [Pyrenochaeta sp. DS3sAY3a]|nr:hypothetical protein IQ07DRAFT_253288 [Pyrenochaeta sp. DS3sAY3a]